MAVMLAIIVPTFNERENIRLLISSLSNALKEVHWEVIFVDDDSPDGTSDLIRVLAREDNRVRLLQRIGRKGLASACVEGMLSTSAPYIAVMDGDLQHDEHILPEMLRRMQSESLDIVVGSRNADGGGMGEFSRARVQLSNVGRRLSSRLAQGISDPMSGFFLVRADYVHCVKHNLSQRGFKILLDLIASSDAPVALAEVPYIFRKRHAGESKLDISTLGSYLYLLADQTCGYWLPLRFCLFCFVGTSGVLAYLAVSWLAMHLSFSFAASQMFAIFAAMTWNYVWNTLVTFRGVRFAHRSPLTRLVIWYAACLTGAYFNLRIAEYLKSHDLRWQFAAVGGLVIGAAWNYAVTSILLWRSSSRLKGRKRGDVNPRRNAAPAKV